MAANSTHPRGPKNDYIVVPSEIPKQQSRESPPINGSVPGEYPTDDQKNVTKSVFTSNFAAKTWPKPDRTVLPTSNRRALVVAIAYDSGRTPPDRLTETYTDAHRIIEMLGKFGYTSQDICVLADIDIKPAGARRYDKSRWPSIDNITEGLYWLTDGSGPNMYRFLFFAGHGYSQRRKTKPENIDFHGSNEAILPADVEYRAFEKCEGCECQPNQLPVPKPGTVLWDSTINQILAESLRAGTKLTVVFDCCHSGGTLRNAMHNLKNASHIRSRGWIIDTVKKVGDMAQAALSSLLDETPDPVPTGNFLGLPIRKKLLATDDATEQAMLGEGLTQRGNTSLVCHFLDEVGVKPGEHAFKFEDCEIVCWASCREVDSAYEDRGAGGRFTAAFTDYVGQRLHTEGGTYRLLNRHIQEKFEQYNEGVVEGKKQCPRLFTSAKSLGGGDESYFSRRLDM